MRFRDRVRPAPGPLSRAASALLALAAAATSLSPAAVSTGPAGLPALDVSVLAAQEEASGSPDPQEALAGYDSLVEASLEAWRVPGAAVTVVVDGEVLVADGFGVRDRSSGEPVTPSTLFPIGSVSKAFTSLLVADLVEEGELAWDRPVHDVLPGFRLHDDYATLHATPVDLLSHRTGLPRHDLAWIAAGPSPGFDRDRAMRKIRHFRPSAGFRSTFQYNNWMYMAAGRMAAAVAGGTWEHALRRRLLAPMGMDRTTFWVDSMTADPDHSSGYRTDFTGAGGEALDEPVVRRAEPFDPGPLGPAGSLVSTAEEMAAWLKLHMSGGSVDGTRVVPEAAVRATHTPRIAVHGQLEQLLAQPELSPPTYGLGWFVQNYRGHRLIHHGGGIDGFSSAVGVLPEEDVGVSVLTNNERALLAYALLFSTLDRLLGRQPRDWSARYRGVMQTMLQGLRGSSPDSASGGGTPDHEPDAYAGRYVHPGYGELEVRSTADGLEASYHGMELRLEHRAHDVFVARADEPPLDLMAPTLHFRTGVGGDVRGVAVPLEPSLDEPILFEKAPDPAAASIPRETLESYAGAYTVAGATVEVRLRGDGALVLDQPGSPALEMRPAGEASFVVEQGGARAEVEFVRESGRVAAMVLTQGGRTFRAEKQEGGGGGG